LWRSGRRMRMGKRDQRVDEYIDRTPAFAKPILVEIRERVHAACPDVEETKSAVRAHVRKAMELNEAGITVERPVRERKPEIVVPADFAAAVKKNNKAQATFDTFSPSHRREYIEWVIEAKTDATRAKRLQQTVEWLAEGKPRNWKYM